MPQINLGTVANDNTGSPLRTGGQLINQYGLLGDKTVNAAFYKTASITIEAALNLAIPAAAALGTGAAVWIPASMLPYNASLVSFNSTVKMFAEGQSPNEYNVRAYGAAGNLAQDDTVAVQAAINAANLALPSGGITSNIVYLPAGRYLCTATIQIPVAANQGQVTLRGAGMRASQLDFSGATTNFTAAPTVPALLLMGAAIPDAAGTFTNFTEYCGVENLNINGTLLTGAGNVRGIQFTECNSCWMENVLVQNLPNSSTGFYLRGATVTGGLGALTTQPETRECNFKNLVMEASIGTGASSKPSSVIFQNADENNFYDCVFGITTGLTGSGQDSIFIVWFQQGRQNRFYGTLCAGDTGATKTNYAGIVFGPPVNEAGVANGGVKQNQTYGDWIEGVDIGMWNRADGSGNTTGNVCYSPNIAVYGKVFQDDNAGTLDGRGGFLSFGVFIPGLGPPDGPINYLSGCLAPYGPAPSFSPPNTATPDVSGVNFANSNNSSPTTYTNFLNGKGGQRLTIFANDANTSIASNTNILGLPGTIKLNNGSAITLIQLNDGKWHYESPQALQRVLYQTAGLNITGTSDASVASYSLPGGALNINNQGIRIRAGGREVTQNGTVNIKFGATLLIGFNPTAGSNWDFEAIVTRTGATAQLATGHYGFGGSYAVLAAQPAETLANAITVDFRGSVTAGGTLDYDYASVEFLSST